MLASQNIIQIPLNSRYSSLLSKLFDVNIVNYILNVWHFSYHIPEIRIVTVEPLRAGNDCELILKFINPTQHQTTVNFLPLSYEEPEVSLESEEKEPISDSSEQPSSITEVNFKQSFFPGRAVWSMKSHENSCFFNSQFLYLYCIF